jgi:hypothetical protein
MEAMALRRPVLATYVAGIPELVIPKKQQIVIRNKRRNPAQRTPITHHA